VGSLILSQGHSVHICTVQYVCIRYSRVEEGLGGSKRGWWVVEMGRGGGVSAPFVKRFGPN
jgi:hypothetical protein